MRKIQQLLGWTVGVALTTGDALAADKVKTVGTMITEMGAPLGATLSETLTWAYSYLAAAVGLSALFGLAYIFIKGVWTPNGGGNRSHSEQANSEHRMEKILVSLFLLVVFSICVGLVYDKFLKPA
jgi:predicted MFS family arabinose efflux permease